MAQQPLARHALLIIETLRSHSVTPHSIGLLLTRDKPEPGTSTWHTQYSQQTDLHASGGVRTHNPSNRAVTGVGYNVLVSDRTLCYLVRFDPLFRWISPNFHRECFRKGECALYIYTLRFSWRFETIFWNVYIYIFYINLFHYIQ
jgi:hypothetical protein